MLHKQITSDNGTVHYWIEKNLDADAKCIVFTHGLTADHTMFEKQVEFFKSKCTVITWDVPLHGLSQPYDNFSYREAALQLKNILQQEKIKKAVLVGMSMGGYPSQMFAYLYPHMVEGFIGLDTTPFGLEYYSKLDLLCLKLVKPLAECIPDSIIRKVMAKSVSKTEYSYKKIMDMLQNSTKEQIITQLFIAYSEFAIENRDITFSFPVLILLGDSDKTGKVRSYCEKWSQNTGYPLHIIKNAAHFSNGDNDKQVNLEIETFLNNIKR